MTLRSSSLIVACLGLVAAAPLVAQGTNPSAGRVLGQAIAAGVALATDDFAAAGRYDVSDEADSSFRVRQLGGRHRFRRPGRWEPFVGGRLGQVRLSQKLDLGGSSRSPLDFDVVGLAVEAGVRSRLGGGWFGELRTETGYSGVGIRFSGLRGVALRIVWPGAPEVPLVGSGPGAAVRTPSKRSRKSFRAQQIAA